MFFKKKVSLEKFAGSLIEDSIKSIEANKDLLNKVFETLEIKVDYTNKQLFELLMLEWFTVSRSIISVSDMNFDSKKFLNFYSDNLFKKFKEVYGDNALKTELIHERLVEYNQIFDTIKEDRLGFTFGKAIINNFFGNKKHEKDVFVQQAFSGSSMIKMSNTVDFIKKTVNNFNIS